MKIENNKNKCIAIIVTLLLVTLVLSGCLDNKFEENIYNTWISQYKIDLHNGYKPEYEYIIFLSDGTYQTNIFEHLFIEGNFYLKQENDNYFFQLEYKGNTTVFQYTYEDDLYDVLKIKNSENIVTVFHRDKTV